MSIDKPDTNKEEPRKEPKKKGFPIYPVFKIQERVYLKTDPEQLEHTVTEIVYGVKEILYGIVHSDFETTVHSDYELTHIKFSYEDKDEDEIDKKGITINPLFHLKQRVFIKTDPDQCERMVTAIVITSNGLRYELTYSDCDPSYHYGYEISDERILFEPKKKDADDDE